MSFKSFIFAGLIFSNIFLMTSCGSDDANKISHTPTVINHQAAQPTVPINQKYATAEDCQSQACEPIDCPIDRNICNSECTEAFTAK